jgi:isopentenyl diphosphate isomerase/L-lactate dehydrogenase-like FMN-dependent dehydrogenase
MGAAIPAWNIADLRGLARQRLPRGIFDYLDRGAEDEVGVRRNREAFDDIKLLPRIAVDVRQCSQDIELFGRRQAMPLIVAPTGAGGLLWYDGDVAIAKAAKEAGIPFALSTAAMVSIERIAAEVGGTLWFQLYIWNDRSLSYQLLERAEKCGYEALLITVDTAVVGNREYNMHNGFSIPFNYRPKSMVDVLRHPRWLMGTMLRYLLTTGMPKFANHPSAPDRKITQSAWGVQGMTTDSMTWDDVREMRRRWKGPLIVKGILDKRDALSALDCGVDGIVISNHGGRNVDSAPATIEVLPGIVDAVGDRMTVLLDSGVRRGSDVVKALALGATAAMVGRATLYGVAAHGQPGATRAIDLLREEIGRIQAQIGCPSSAALSREFLYRQEEIAYERWREDRSAQSGSAAHGPASRYRRSGPE